MDFEWDENKNKSNIEKHGIDFNEVKDIFKDKNRIESPDNRKDYGEPRFKAVGKAIDLILSIIFTMRGTTIRLISARSASKIERDEYNKNA